MSEDYRIISAPRGEPRSSGDVGVRVRLQLSGRPSRRWSRDLGAQLTRELVRHPGAAHLRVKLDELVQGDEIVLDGIEDRDTPGLADAVRRAIDAANRAEAREVDRAPNVSQGEADAVAGHIPLNESNRPGGSGANDDPCCPRCGHAVPVTAGDRAAGDQLAVAEIDCPSCGVRLVRDIQGHADRGWRRSLPPDTSAPLSPGETLAMGDERTGGV
jgi:hypothetical protein